MMNILFKKMFTTQVDGEQYHSDSLESNITDSRNTEPIKIELNLQHVTQSSKIAEVNELHPWKSFL